MTSQGSIAEKLCDAAMKGDLRRGFTFVDEQGETFYSFGEIAEWAAQYAAAMLRLGLRRGERVALALPKSEEFVGAFLGAIHAGLVPVPMYPPQGLGKLGFYLEHARHILRASQSTLLITSAQVKTVLGSLIGGKTRFIRTVEGLGVDGTKAPLTRSNADDPAFLQFTSGSTSRPKGVLLTHGNIGANVGFFTEGLKANRDDVGCSWLPLYHDMGLIGFVLAPIFNCTPAVLMSPYVFLKRPVEWLRRISRHRATISFAPNFGYELCASRVRERDREALDLSSWRVAGCGAEPIQASTLERFHACFKSVGFDQKAFTAAYGLAENTLAVCFSSVGTPPQSERVSLHSLTSDGFAAPVDADDPSGIKLVNCGRPLRGQELAIVDGSGNRCAPRQVGEIVIRGPAVMRGYYNDSMATADVIKKGWLHTGDLGFLVDGELFVCGRIKDLIITAGRNYYPADIEWIASDVPGLRPGRVVAFGLTVAESDEGAERVVICAETKTRPLNRPALAEQVASHVLEALGLRVSEVLLLDRGSLPRTSSGKLQRNKTRELYLTGGLETASRNEGKLALFGHLAGSQWGFFKSRVNSAIFGWGPRLKPQPDDSQNGPVH